MSGKRQALWAFLGLVAVAFGARPTIEAGESHDAEIEAWRKGRMERLMSDTGYLTLAGLFWLDEGKHTFGSAPDNDLVFPKHSAPAHAGFIMRTKDGTRIHANAGTELVLDGKRVSETRMIPDSEEGTTTFTLGDLSFWLIQRSDRFGIRLRDVHSEIRKNFGTIEAYPVQESYRVEARFEPYDPPKETPILNEVGTTSMSTSPGALVFTLNGKECRLDPLADGLDDESWFIIFADHTTGDETYGSGRFLYTGPPVDGKVIVDFNKAYNPPCAFSPYTTCPLPPPQNHLDVAVRAGEKAYDGDPKTTKH